MFVLDAPNTERYNIKLHIHILTANQQVYSRQREKAQCYALNCVPQYSYAEVLTPHAAESNHI